MLNENIRVLRTSHNLSQVELTSENTVSLDGLSDRQAAHIRMIIADLSEK